jgi:uncharacterized protein (TIGR02147 family)
MVFEHGDYRSYLRRELVERIQRNPCYSLRSMARDIGIAGSSLSEAMNGKANISQTLARKIALRLGLNSDETEYFCLLVQYESVKDPMIRASLQERIRCTGKSTHRAHDLSIDLFKMISDWYHSPILVMTGNRNFRFEPKEISRRLGITELEARTAIDRLLRLELIEEDGQGGFRRVHDRVTTQSPEASRALQHFYAGMLEKAKEALGSQTPKQRISGFETVELDEELLPEAAGIAERFFSEMVQLADRSKKRKHIYHVLLHVFNLTPARPQKGQGV